MLENIDTLISMLFLDDNKELGNIKNYYLVTRTEKCLYIIFTDSTNEITSKRQRNSSNYFIMLIRLTCLYAWL